MNKNLIKSYALTIKKEDIFKFANKEGINVTEKEAELILNAIQNDTEIILSSDSILYLESYKDKISDELYNKLLDYYYKYEKFTR